MHSIRNHKTIEDIIQKCISFEDIDYSAVISPTAKGQFSVDQFYAIGRGGIADTLLEAFYLTYGPECWCDDEY